MNEPRQRLFFALWPSPPLAQALRRLARERFADPGARILQADQLHLTLIYLGPVDTQQRTCAEQVADGVRADALTLSLSRLGFWSRPGIGWLAPQSSPPSLLALVSQLQRGLGECGFQIDARPWQAHLTLVRKLRRPPLSEALDEPLLWPVDEFALVESQTLPSGAEYRILQRWSLVGHAPQENH
ncbi:MAG: RNA 2',3'-cyclic phosphodiesterase [Thiohalophilus sp.]|uniref:RNA 2',3'-cyclic phosphodiesterase n=1 Tax=Thiohalophilus sp. TaxID=3028392 RepID=UPI0028709658|nr:RNA 2',3'-cyclic phosphodiesterase [Thiohalophilus sp.]MDR9435858.1 RNA 2',3'-cyclic phosphodiesterase [Thiohalophilus sp.]